MKTLTRKPARRAVVRGRPPRAAAAADPLSRVRNLAQNLWWSWNASAMQLFASLDPLLWEASEHNPLKTLRLLAPERADALRRDERFLEHLADCEKQLDAYLAVRTWFDRTHAKKNVSIAYFCAEFAIHESLPQYSGGLGVLAGDHVKSASDLGLPFVAIGLLYRNGFYTHEFNADGSTRVTYPRVDFADLPITDTGSVITVPMGAAKIRARIWRQLVGRV